MIDRERQMQLGREVMDELIEKGLIEIVRYNEEGKPVYRRTLAGKVETLKQWLGEGDPTLN
jgi:hypothetical protein